MSKRMYNSIGTGMNINWLQKLIQYTEPYKKCGMIIYILYSVIH